ncbi:hypothetical protein SAY86_007595 [Trapa natans]|uniref:F-box domain-containing protein n=1 Tax=Trapa natans TaxID=22666 RepID=A0AAN7LBY7_TRANT|nr:hypothetical protein SAY86_007595 [Trapa natans]
MSKVFRFSGKNDFFRGDSIYSGPREGNLFLSLGRRVDLYFPPSKRSRISAPVDIKDNADEFNEVFIESLPDECLFEILRRLPGDQERSSCACVSKRWLTLLSNISWDELHSDKVVSRVSGDLNTLKEGEEEKEETQTESNGHLSRILEGMKATDTRLAAISVGTSSRGGLGKLLVRGSNPARGVTDVGLRAVARGCPTLRVLSLWNVPSVGDEGLIEIAKGCPLLEKLDLRQCPSITDCSLAAFAEGCPNLTEVTLDSCRMIGNEGLQGLARGSLRSVTIKDCPLVGDQGIVGLVSNATSGPTKLKLHGLHLTDLSLAVIGRYGKQVTGLVLENLSDVTERGFWVMGNGHGLQKLSTLSISSCQGVTDLGFDSIGKGCPGLKQLCVRRCSVLSDNGLVSLAKSAPSLERLQLEECHRVTQYGLFGLIVNSRESLRSLSIKSCLGIKDFDKGMELPLVIPPCESLRSLSITNCPGFGDSNLIILGKMCSRLQNLDLSGLSGITDSGLLPLLEGSKVGFVKVNVSGCNKVTDESVSTLCRTHGWCLEVLNIDSCHKIGDRSLVAISQNCQILSDLDVSYSAVSDLGIAELAHCDRINLQVLSVAGCHISDKSVPGLKNLGRSLLGLNLQRCNGISQSSVNHLIEQLWKCDILH